MENKHAVFIPTDVLTQVQNLVKQANALLLPYVTSLTPTERRTMAKMGEKTLSFVEKAHEFATQNLNLVPPFLDMTAFNTDFADAHNLWSVLLASQQLHENLDDTTMASGSEAYQAALIFYNSVKMAARQDIPGAKAVYEELKKRFPGPKRKNHSNGDQKSEIEE
ncbi:MAG: hypothetical protein LBJ72_08070 [Dysgonamonadaceae bacterium]|jgi:hypothetical protein|nr:hypothetical protein [Dysgonamonadaceae bacterium]